MITNGEVICLEDLKYDEIFLQKIINIIFNDFKIGNWNVNIPKYQTHADYFLRDNEVLKKIKLDLLVELEKKFNKKFKPDRAWAYVSVPGEKGDHISTTWHDHLPSHISAIMYVTLPKNKYGELVYTTEFKNKNGRTFFNEPVIGKWFAFDSDIVHRPGYWDWDNVEENRYVLAATFFMENCCDIS